MEQAYEQKIQVSFDTTLKDTDLENLSIDMAELAIDSVLDDGILRDVPIVSTFVGLAKFGANVHDKLFLKKILTFLTRLNGVPAEKRRRMVNDIDSSKEHKVKVGEKLLYIIDTCHDHETSDLVGTLFKAYLEGKISYNEFLKASTILGKIDIDDFKWFIKERKSHYFHLSDIGYLIGSGLFYLRYEPIDVEVTEDADADYQPGAIRSGKFETDVNGGVDVSLSRAGQVILEIFCPTYKKPRVIQV